MVTVDSRTRYPTIAAAADAICAECGGPAPAGPARTAHRMPDGWLFLCATCSPEHYQAYRSARVAAELAERAARPKPAAAKPELGRVCRSLTKNELWIEFGTPAPDDWGKRGPLR